MLASIVLGRWQTVEALLESEQLLVADLWVFDACLSYEEVTSFSQGSELRLCLDSVADRVGRGAGGYESGIKDLDLSKLI